MVRKNDDNNDDEDDEDDDRNADRNDNAADVAHADAVALHHDDDDGDAEPVNHDAVAAERLARLRDDHNVADPGCWQRLKNRVKTKTQIGNLSSAFAESYRGLMLLHDFGHVNSTAIDKILKKHDKQLGTSFRGPWQAQNV